MPMKIGDPLPPMDGATDWFNGSLEEAMAMSEGNPVLVHFWSVSCGICKEKMPQIQQLKKKFGSRGLQTIAVHMPRSEADTDRDTVDQAISRIGLSEPCAVDGLHKLKEAFQNEQGWVPVYYLFDSEGKLKTRSAGEFGVGILQSALEKMFPPRSAAA